MERSVRKVTDFVDRHYVVGRLVNTSSNQRYAMLLAGSFIFQESDTIRIKFYRNFRAFAVYLFGSRIVNLD